MSLLLLFNSSVLPDPHVTYDGTGQITAVSVLTGIGTRRRYTNKAEYGPTQASANAVYVVGPTRTEKVHRR